MKILAIDTSAGAGSVAISDNKKIIGVVNKIDIMKK